MFYKKILFLIYIKTYEILTIIIMIFYFAYKRTWYIHLNLDLIVCTPSIGCIEGAGFLKIDNLNIYIILHEVKNKNLHKKIV